MQPPYKYKAIITNVVDGDTVDARVDLGFTVSVDVRFRLYGIDTAEMNSVDEEQRELAKQAKQYLTNTILNKEVLIKTHKPDKFGRWLVEIFISEDYTINNLLLEKKLAKSYYGGTR